MASLTGSTIAASYEQLLSLPDGGLNGTTLVAITDGDSSNTIPLQVATDKLLITDDAKLYFGSGSDASIEYDEDGADNLSIAGSDVSIANGIGLIVGHTTQETISIGDGATDLVPEVQILGTAQTDASLMLAAFSTTATSAGAPLIALVKGGNGTIGSHTVVTDGEELGNIIAYGDDGTDLESPAASIQFEVDGTPGSSDMPGRILFNTTADGATALTERVRITSAGGIHEVGGVLKENLLANSGFGVWSNSTLEDVTAVFVDDMADNGTGDWTNEGDELVFDTDHYELSTSGINQQTYKASVNFTAGKLYQVSIMVKNGSASGKTLKIMSYDGSSTFLSPTITTTGTSVTHTFVFEASATTTGGQTGIKSLEDLGGDNIELKDFQSYEVTPACIASNRLACDGWNKDTTNQVYRVHNDGGTLTKDGSFYSLKFVAAGSGDYVGQTPGGYPLQTDREQAEVYQRFAGRTVTFGCWCKTSADNIFIRFYDGSTTDSANLASTDAWVWTEKTVAVSASATAFDVSLRTSGAGTYYISQPMLVFGSSIGEGNYTRPNGEVIYFEKKKNSNLLGSFGSPARSSESNITLNVEGDSSGIVPKDAKAILAHMVHRDSGSPTDCNFYVTGSTNISGLYSRLGGIASDGIQHHNGWVPCDGNGDVVYNISATGSSTSDVQLNYEGVMLR